MAVLQDILYKVSIRSVQGSTQVVVTDLQLDSRKVEKASAFIALKGVSSDGQRFEAVQELLSIRVLQHHRPPLIIGI